MTRFADNRLRAIPNASVERETGQAILVNFPRSRGNAGALWIPKSQIHEDSEVYGGEGVRGTLIITHWIAEQKGIAEEGDEYEPR